MKPTKPKSYKFLNPTKVKGVKSVSSGEGGGNKGGYSVRKGSGSSGDKVIATMKMFPTASIVAKSFPGSYINVDED